MLFGDIVQRFEAPLNDLYRERDARSAKGLTVVDLVSGNANKAGFVFPQKILKQALTQGADRARIYAPHPLGQPDGRAAVHRYYRAQGLEISPDHILLTPGTSLAYGYLFKLLANPGDEILCPRPSYPLLDSIAEISHVHLTSYRLVEKTRWEIDLDSLKAGITSKTRAILLISPHNPTGAVASPEEIAGLGKIAARHDLPVISDEVFSGFLFNSPVLPRPAALELPLVFTLNGVSKMLALPGLKLGWIAVSGRPSYVQKAMKALDMISDTFLPVSEPVQFALPALLTKAKAFMRAYGKGVRDRMELATRAVQKIEGLSFVKPEGGFYLTLRINGGKDESEVALRLLKEKGLLAHPGYFYDLKGSHLVISFVLPVKTLSRSLQKFPSPGRAEKGS